MPSLSILISLMNLSFILGSLSLLTEKVELTTEIPLVVATMISPSGVSRMLLTDAE